MRHSTSQAAIIVMVLAASAGAGTIRGVVQSDHAPAPKVADRYDGAKGAKPMGSIPTVVYLEGPVAGHAPAAPANAPVIVQKDLAFAPTLLVVPPGASVGFPNQDKEFHNVFSYSPTKRFDLGRYPKGESKSVTFDKPGIVKIYCEIHEFMRAAVVVVENPFHTVAGSDGSFTLEGVPPGEYRLVVWNIDRGSKKTTVRVTDAADPPVVVRLARHDPTVPVEAVSVLALGDAPPAPGGCCALP